MKTKSKVEAYINQKYGKPNDNLLKDDFRRVGLELIQANIRMAKAGTMSKEEAMTEIKKLDKAIDKI